MTARMEGDKIIKYIKYINYKIYKNN